MNIRTFYTWHRRTGVVISLIVVLLVITGFALNHTERFGLDKRFINTNWILDWYQIEVKGTVLAYKVNGDLIVQLGERLYKNTTEIKSDVTQLVGAIEIDDMTIIALDQELVLVDQQGEIIEILSGVDGVPSGMRAIGKSREGEVYLEAAYGMYQVDIEDLTWVEQEIKDDSVVWAIPSTIDKSLYKNIEEQYRGKGLNLERVLLDLHSGRIFGHYGVLVVDLVGGLLLLLVISGFYMWFKRL